ncbi:hypothetical protein D3C80_2110480 [compost metagenome]
MCLVIIKQRFNQLHRVDIAFVARRDDMPETNPGLGACKGDAIAESSALRHQRYRSFLEFRFTRNAAECGVDT